jgi:protocatechuate 3,4-dioxygenase, beta subunit
MPNWGAHDLWKEGRRTITAKGDFAMRTFKSSRRALLMGAAASVSGLFSARSLRAAGLTPRAAEGQFYPTGAMRPSDVDNDLVKIAGRVREAGGKIFVLKGRVTDKDENPREGLRVEIWQCDVNGTYIHPGDNRRVTYDGGFQGFGHDVTGPDGTYRFRTIKPGKYPGRTEHIHVKVLDGARELLTTQFYVADNANNDRDSLFSRLSAAQANSVSMVYQNGPDGEEAIVNIVI